MFFFPSKTEAQLFDSIKYFVSKKPTIDFRLDSRNNFISSRKASTFGIKLGFDYNSRLRIGLGYNFLRTNFYERTIIGIPPNRQVRSYRLTLQYICFYVDYVYYNSRKWTFSVPVQVGLGQTSSVGIFPAFEKRRNDSSPIMLYEPCLSGEYRVLPWFALNANAGFRIVLLKGASFRQKLTAPMYVAGVSIYWSMLYNSFFIKR
jgi:hypothetical protein